MSLRKKYESVYGKLDKGYEVHHKLPRHAGGTDDIENLIALTREEHKQAHLKRHKEVGGHKDLCSYHMINYNFTEAHRISSSVGGTIGGNKVKEQGNGICDLSNPLRKEWASMGGSAAQATLKERKVGAYYDPILKLEISSKGGKNGAFTKPEIQSELGKRGGIKNKGYVWVNDGIKSFKFTKKMQEKETLEDYLLRTNHVKGRL